MNESAKIFWGTIGAKASTTTTPAMWGIPKLMKIFNKNKIKLTAKVQSAFDQKLEKKFGCPVLRVKIISRGHKKVKIQKVVLSAEIYGMSFIPDGADEVYEFATSGEGAPPPQITINMLPLTKPNDRNGLILDRGDCCEFVITANHVLLEPLTHLESEKLKIVAHLHDNSEIVMSSGPDLLLAIRHLFAESQENSIHHELRL